MRRVLVLAAVTVLGIVVLALPSMAGPGIGIPDKVTTAVGDLNGDGHSEIAKETWNNTGHYVDLTVQIVSRRKVQLEVKNLLVDLGEGFKVVGKSVVIWRAEPGPRRYDPHYYNYTWYGWNAKAKKLVQGREGFTQKPFANTVASFKRLMNLAENPGQEIVQSHTASFSDDALRFASQKYGHRFNQAEPIAVPPQEKPVGRAYILEPNLQTAKQIHVICYRDGSFGYL